MYVDRTHLTQTQVCYLLKIDQRTLKRWYKYIETTPPEEIPKDCPGLPTPKIVGKNGQKLFYGADIHQLFEFQQWIPKGRKGVMGKISQKHWGFIRRQKEQQNKTL